MARPRPCTFVKPGYRVTILEKGKELALGASGHNGAQLSYSFTDVLASPETLRLMPKVLLGQDPAIKINSRFDPKFLAWGLNFLANCTASKSERNTLAVLQLALESQQEMKRIQTQYNFSFNYRQAAKLQVFEGKCNRHHLEQKLTAKRAMGANVELIDATQCYNIEPNLAYSEIKISAGIYSPEDEVGDVVAFTDQVVQKTIGIGSNRLLMDTTVHGVRRVNNKVEAVLTNHGEVDADHIVVCAGLNSVKLGKKFGLVCAPIYPVAGYSLTYPAIATTPSISITDSRMKLVVCRLGNHLRVAGMADIGALIPKQVENRLSVLARIIQKRFPQAGDYINPPRTWSGVRPMTANGKPLIGPNCFEQRLFERWPWNARMDAGSSQRKTNY